MTKRKPTELKYWRWYPGMRAVGRRGMPEAWFRVEEELVCLHGEWSEAQPDLEDPATVGCLLAHLRTLLGDPWYQPRALAVGGITSWDPAARGNPSATTYASYGGALLGALENYELRETDSEENLLYFSTYQLAAARTINTEGSADLRLAVLGLGLAGESAELLEQYEQQSDRDEVKAELGDVAWYIAALCTHYGRDMREIIGKDRIASFRPACRPLPGVARAAGLSLAAGKVADTIKKMVGHGHPNDWGALVPLLRDTAAWVYSCAAGHSLELTDVLQSNLAKLRVRYAARFTTEESVARRDVEPRAASIPTDWEHLRTLTMPELEALGCTRWEGLLMLFPLAWYEHIPEGFVVQTISGKEKPFESGVSEKDHRYGFLPYGVKAAPSFWR